MSRIKNVVIGISGGIAAYKTLTLIRLFKAYGCDVKVIATAHALEFVTPLSIETLSQHRVYIDSFQQPYNYEVDHIALSDWADVVVIAPATANVIAKLSHGIADDFLSTFVLAYTKPMFIASSMNNKMYAHVTVQNNLKILQQRGHHLIEPVEGELACGTAGKGRMEEPEQIFEKIIYSCDQEQPLKGKKALVTAGPTFEPIDAVRFIGNHSSGLMGFAMAETLANYGAEVILISGPTNMKLQNVNIQRFDVQTASEMYDMVMNYFGQCDIAIMAAAVADYSPANKATNKIKKNEIQWALHLQKTVDILAEMGKRKQKNQLLVGFALETDNEIENAISKLENKNLDFIVLNSLQDDGAGFKTKTNKITIIDKNKKLKYGELKDKYCVAQDVVNEVINIIMRKNNEK